jgi:hypothetical protein
MLHKDVRDMFLAVQMDPQEFEDSQKIAYDRFLQMITAPDIKLVIEVRSLKRIKAADRINEYLDYGCDEVIHNPHLKRTERFQKDQNAFYMRPIFEYSPVQNEAGYTVEKATGVQSWEPTYILPFTEKEATRLYNLIPASRRYTAEYKIQIEGLEKYFTIPDFEIWRDSDFDLLWEWGTTRQKPQEIKEKEIKIREKRKTEIKKAKEVAASQAST